MTINIYASDKMYLSIKIEDYMVLRAQLEKTHEVGGIFKLQGRNLVPIFTSNGDSNSIHVNNQVPFNFHTHPGVCRNKHSCSLGMPSSQDMKLILDSAAQGNVAHFVIAHEGIYIVQVDCRLLRQYRQYGASVIDRVKLDFKQFQDNFSTNGMSYEQFIPAWIQFARSRGFNVLFYPNGSVLSFMLNSPCENF